MMRYIHFYEGASVAPDFVFGKGIHVSELEIKRDEQVHTIHMELLANAVREDTIVYIHKEDGEIETIECGRELPHSKRMARPGLNYYNLWKAGEI